MNAKAVLILLVLLLSSCAKKALLYSFYSANSSSCFADWSIELREDSSYVMTREIKEANKFYSYGKWSLAGDSLLTKNSIPSTSQLVNISYSNDPGLPDSVMLVRMVDINNVPVSGYLSTTHIERDSSFRERDYLFGKCFIPVSTTQIRLLLLFVSTQQLSYSVNIANGNVVTLKVNAEDPKFYDIYNYRKFLIISKKRKLLPIPNIDGSFVLVVAKGAKMIN